MARQISDFVSRLLHLKGVQIMTLADIYCIYNRSRGTALISPADLLAAAQQFSPLGLQVRLRTLRSGLKVIQAAAFSDDAFAERVLGRFGPGQESCSASELAQWERITVQLATELLSAAESTGRLVRDASTTGLLYYPNKILHNN